MDKIERIPFGDLRRHYQLWHREIDAAIKVVLESGWFILGKNLAAFEQEFATYCGAQYAVGVGSGTEALHLALLACGVGPGDEVLTVPLTAVPTANAISCAGAKPTFADIDPSTFTMDPGDIERRLTGRTKVILPVHLYGQAADMEPICEIGRRHGIRIVEDACQAHGAEYKGQKAGTIGDVGCFSFYPSKNLGAFGDAGAIVTNNSDIAEKVALLRNYGQTKRYYHEIKGLNSRLDEMQAAILRVRLPMLDAWNERRRQIALRYSSLLVGSTVRPPVEASYGKHVYHLYVVRSPRRDDLQRHLQSLGVETLIHYPVPVHLQTAYSDLGFPAGSFPHAEAAASEILSLPIYPELTDDAVQRVVEAVLSFR